MEELKLRLGVTAWRTLSTSSLIPNVDSERTPTSYLATGSNAQRNHQLSTKGSMNSPKTTLASFVRTHHQTMRLTSSLLVCHSQEISMTCTHLYHSGTTTKYKSPTSIQGMDQRMVTLSFRFGEITSLILEMISDATSVLDQQKPTL